MNVFIKSVTVATLLLTMALPAFAYTGNARTSKFHYDDCRWAQKISDYNRVYLDSRQEAINNGYVPCKVCKP